MTNYIVPKSMTFATPIAFPGIGPGDCLLMEPGVRTGITFKGFKGEYGNDILITNQDGLVDINTSYTLGWAVYFRDCQHIIFSGKGCNDYEYGIKISESNTGALHGYRKTEYIEIENIEVTKTGIGISAKTTDDENGDPVIRGEWTQHDTTIHDCYIHDIRGEGLYIGSSSWGNGIHPALNGVYAYNNIIENAGYDGIQISSAPDNVEVHHNYINGAGWSMEGRPPNGANNVSGIILGAGARGKVYNNKVINSGGRGIYANMVDEVFNNIIINTGVMGWDGISHGMNIGGGLIHYNTIINPKNNGINIRYKLGKVRDNIIAGYGDSAIVGANAYNNLESRSMDTIGFVNPGENDFHLLPDSIAINKGSESSYPGFDLDGIARPQDNASDIGAYEYPKSDIMTTYYIENNDKIVDGNTFCDGRKCTSADTIIIRGGARGNLLLRNFDGNGSYIPILNENGTSRVEITNDASVGFGVLSLSNCKYIDLRGNNNNDFNYGIHVRDCDPARAHAVWVYGESDHIKLGYLEADCIGNTSISGCGIHVGDRNLTDAWTFDIFEIHHNYVHDTRYCGLYLGQNRPSIDHNPYIARFVVHDNILKDLGTYGAVIKGLNGGPNSYYNNFVDTTDLVFNPNVEAWGDAAGSWKSGLRVRTYSHKYSVDVYNNTVFNTVGPGILVGKGSHNIYGNIVCGCGTGNDVDWGHGIVTILDTTGTHIYDNIIIQPVRYGVYNKQSATAGVTLSRNLIGDAGLGEWAEAYSGDTVESTGTDANIYHANVSDFGFKAWSNDGNYSNDDFSFPTQQAKGEISNVDYPASVNHSDNFDINVVVKNIGAMSGIFKTQIMVDGTIVSTSNEFILINGETSPSMINQFIAPPSGDSMNIDVKCIRII